LLVSHRPLVFLPALTVGDYLLWNWSVGGDHDVLALVSGFSLPPLAVASIWLLALGLIRLVAGATRRSNSHSARSNRRAEQKRRGPVVAGERAANEHTTPTRTADRPSRKLAA
jgi:hypothetical protein